MGIIVTFTWGKIEIFATSFWAHEFSDQMKNVIFAIHKGHRGEFF